LFDLDAPTPANVRVSAGATGDPDERPERSTMEFLIDLDDDPARTVSREIDLDADPTLAAAVHAAAAEADARDAVEDAPVDTGLAPDAIDDSRPERLVTLPVPEQARSAEEQHQQRKLRVMDRVATARDAFRFVGHMGIVEDQRKGVARMLLELEKAVLEGEAGGNLVKDPRTALAGATKAQLDAAERLLGPIEEKLLNLDDQIGDSVFDDRIANTKQSKKIIARYGRLLASRRMPPGPRRNRFESLAVNLLTRRSELGGLVPLPPDRARNVLQHLIGGLPRKVRQQEVDEATDYLHEVGKRLDDVRSVDQLFDSGLFADLHGYKVTMREHLTSPEFVYRSVLAEVKLRNRLEQWIAAQERLHDKNQLTTEGSPRAQALRRVLAEREDVDGRLGAKARIAVGPTAEEPAQPPPKRKKAQAAKASALSTLLDRLQVDRRLLLGLAMLTIIVVTTVHIVTTLGVVGEPAVRALTKQELAAISPMLSGALKEDMDSHFKLRAWIPNKRWTALDGRTRHAAADTIARKLAASDISAADIYAGNKLVIVIKNGTLVSAEGSKL
jgi:hypothetical protein